MLLALLALVVGVLALTAAGCGGDDDDGDGGAADTSASDGGGGVEALPSSMCSDIEFEGDGEPDVLVASDLPLQGSSRTQTIQMTEAIRKVLADANYKAGDLNVAYQSCDDATAQAAKWDSAKCNQNAQQYASNE